MTSELDLERFQQAQRQMYSQALGEIQAGEKRSHWMWFIFPQLRGLGRSEYAWFYGIEDLAEARRFLADPYLGANLGEICQALLKLETCDPVAVFGRTDAMKLRSSMTLFAVAAGEGQTVFRQVLDKYFAGKMDGKTLKILSST